MIFFIVIFICYKIILKLIFRTIKKTSIDKDVIIYEDKDDFLF